MRIRTHTFEYRGMDVSVAFDIDGENRDWEITHIELDDITFRGKPLNIKTLKEKNSDRLLDLAASDIYDNYEV